MVKPGGTNSDSQDAFSASAAKTKSKSLARQAERKRHQSLEEAIHGIKKRVAPVTLSTAASDWIKLKKPTLTAKSLRIEQVNLDKHLKPALGARLLIDITPDDIADYQRARLKEKASPKTINLEVGTLFVTTVLSIYKPWGLTPYGIRKQYEATPVWRPAPRQSSGRFAIFGIIGFVLLILVLHLFGIGLHAH